MGSRRTQEQDEQGSPPAAAFHTIQKASADRIACSRMRQDATFSITGVHANTSRWFLTLLVVAQHRQEAAPFKMSPQATVAYLGML